MARQDTENRRLLALTFAAMLGGLSVTTYLVYRKEIRYYLGILRAFLASRPFYARYPRLTRDVAFTGWPQPCLDVYSPESGTGHPVLIFVHGGGWKDFHKDLFAPVAMKLLPEAMVVVIPDYTLYPPAGYRQMADEVAAATAWTLDNIGRYGGDPHRVVLAGHSAGAHLIGLVGLDPRYLRARGHSPAELAGLIGVSGVYDVEAQYAYDMAQGIETPVMNAVMGGRHNFAAASPITYVRGDAPPMLVVHGGRDDVVPAHIATAFQAALRRAGAHSRLILYPRAGHSDFLVEAMGAERRPIVADITDFINGLAPARARPQAGRTASLRHPEFRIPLGGI